MVSGSIQDGRNSADRALARYDETPNCVSMPSHLS
jgi:hypothetical protein